MATYSTVEVSLYVSLLRSLTTILIFFIAVHSTLLAPHKKAFARNRPDNRPLASKCLDTEGAPRARHALVFELVSSLNLFVVRQENQFSIHRNFQVFEALHPK
jgi:hypothetical protein